MKYGWKNNGIHTASWILAMSVGLVVGCGEEGGDVTEESVDSNITTQAPDPSIDPGVDTTAPEVSLPPPDEPGGLDPLQQSGEAP